MSSPCGCLFLLCNEIKIRTKYNKTHVFCRTTENKVDSVEFVSAIPVFLILFYDDEDEEEEDEEDEELTAMLSATAC